MCGCLVQPCFSSRPAAPQVEGNPATLAWHALSLHTRSMLYSQLNASPPACPTPSGNLNDNSGTGVCFTRNPATGEKKLYGEYLQNAQVRG